ncbi:hypothetical protein AYJ08_11285 [Brevibacillus sp. SKDU10]|uniref:hypothetical protein n=1 Tax=Brevibacillus sp. SKDU10 TaxID=1247872 RepID=UPI0007C8E97D|nr:hypothetical protein [Brevibacillus sp. SKDU10]OAJ73949.1 hypothetical protein AYJ08_11285 [Brevibacillus sp. SKDU10]
MVLITIAELPLVVGAFSETWKFKKLPDEPVDPVAPVFPVEPVGPVIPVDPVSPVAPVTPVAPVMPVGPGATLFYSSDYVRLMCKSV